MVILVCILKYADLESYGAKPSLATNPLWAYCEGKDGVISPTEYESTLWGATVQISFSFVCHLFGSATGKHTTFSAQISDIIVLKKPKMITGHHSHNGSPSKHAYSGPSFSPSKCRCNKFKASPSPDVL